jgi:hypothetical protein
MRKNISGIALSLIIMLTFTGCERDNQALLTKGVWTFKQMTTDSQNDTITSMITLSNDLFKDVTMEFQEGGTYIKTFPLTEEAETGEWQLIASDQLILDPDNGEVTSSNIETLTKRKLSYLDTFVDGLMDPYTITTVWIQK